MPGHCRKIVLCILNTAKELGSYSGCCLRHFLSPLNKFNGQEEKEWKAHKCHRELEPVIIKPFIYK